jgi:CHAT domain-containing protein
LQTLQDTEVMRAELDSEHRLSPIQTEIYMYVALQNWLTNQHQTEESKRSFRRLADALIQNHGDTWLADFLGAEPSPQANELLQASISANHKGNPHYAWQAARSARQIFLDVGNRSGAARSEFELIYALQRESRAKECIREMPEFVKLLIGKQYRWLDAQLQLELSSCRSMMAEFDSAWRAATEAAQIAKGNHYELLLLRALGFEAEFDTDEGRLHNSWASNISGLDSFWRASFSSERAYQFYGDLQSAAEISNQWHLSALLGREMLNMLAETEHKELVAIAHLELGAILGHLALDEESEEEINQAYDLLSQLPATPATELYKSNCEILMATLEAHRGSREAALQHLRKVGLEVNHNDNFNLQLDYLGASAQVARLGGDSKEEERDLSGIVSVAKQGLGALRSERDRWDWDHKVGSAYRRLVELRIEKPHDTAALLTDWETYREQSILGVSTHAGVHGSKANRYQLLSTRLKQLRGAVLLVFAVLPRQVVVWVADGQGIREFKIPMTQDQLAKRVKEFYRLCSDPNSPLASVNESSSRLYRELLAPLALAGTDQTVFIQADGILGLIPWSALLEEDGRYFGQAHNIINVAALVSVKKQLPSHDMERALVVYPGPVSLEHEQFSALPGAENEADYVAALTREAIVLKYGDATAQRILADLQQSSIFYFAGHAVQREQGGELLVRGAHGGDILGAETLQGLNLPRTKLVVLSACSTALAQDDVSHNPNGLVWSFLEAGSSEVVASLWNVDSSATTALMKDFYTFFREQPSAASALAKAERASRTRQPGLHPYYWASFQSFGTFM